MESATKRIKFEDFSPSRTMSQTTQETMVNVKERYTLLRHIFAKYPHMTVVKDKRDFSDGSILLVAKTDEDDFGDEMYAVCYVHSQIISPTNLEKVYFCSAFNKAVDEKLFKKPPFTLKTRVEARNVRGFFKSGSRTEDGLIVLLRDMDKLPLGLIC